MCNSFLNLSSLVLDVHFNVLRTSSQKKPKTIWGACCVLCIGLLIYIFHILKDPMVTSCDHGESSCQVLRAAWSKGWKQMWYCHRRSVLCPSIWYPRFDDVHRDGHRAAARARRRRGQQDPRRAWRGIVRDRVLRHQFEAHGAARANGHAIIVNECNICANLRILPPLGGVHAPQGKNV